MNNLIQYLEGASLPKETQALIDRLCAEIVRLQAEQAAAVTQLRAENDNLKALAVCETCDESDEDWTLPRFCLTCWNEAQLKAERERDALQKSAESLERQEAYQRQISADLKAERDGLLNERDELRRQVRHLQACLSDSRGCRDVAHQRDAALNTETKKQ